MKAAGFAWEQLKAAADDMTDANRVALRFYLECKATGSFPDDAIVRWYSGIIRDEEDRFAREQSQAQSAYLRNLQILMTPRTRR